MIETLLAPLVCVVDDEEQDYRPILDALNSLYVGALHIKGNSLESLPAEPFKGLRLIFMDLHLAGLVGKAAASHAANVFLKLVSVDTSPVVVVIWSKYSDVPVTEAKTAGQDPPTEAELFTQTLLEAEPGYKDRLIFLRMAKPMQGDRPQDWTSALEKDIKTTLEGHPAVRLLWTWEALVRRASIAVSDGLTSLNYPPPGGTGAPLELGLMTTMQLLAHAQGEGDISAATAPSHLVTVLDQLLGDELEHTTLISALSPHGESLSTTPAKEAVTSQLLGGINSFLLTAPLSTSAKPFLPGTVYECVNDGKFEEIFGSKVGGLAFACWTKRRHDAATSIEEQKSADEQDKAEWRKDAKLVLLEISPDCDVAQNKRQTAMLLAGLILPSANKKNAKTGEAFQTLPPFSLRWPGQSFSSQECFLIFCSRYKLTLPAGEVPDWLKPWFRLRELPTASLRNWSAGHGARIGYVSVRG